MRTSKNSIAKVTRFIEVTSDEEGTMNEAFQRLVEGDSLKDICRAWNVPFGRFLNWVMSDEKRYAIYNRAMEVLAHIEVEEAKTIADTPLIGKITRTRTNEEGTVVGSETTEEDMLAHRKLQVETRFRRAKHHAPERYGEKQEAQIPAPMEAVMEVAAAELIKLISQKPVLIVDVPRETVVIENDAQQDAQEA